jgi:hypothetical protein
MFLRAALESGERGARVGVILMTHAHGADGRAALEGARFAPPLDAVAARSSLVSCSNGHIPWDRLREAIVERTGIDPMEAGENGHALRFLVVGCHTEGRVLALALCLRHFFRCDEVAISHHLVGSSIPEAHLAVLRHTLPTLGVKVLLDLADAARYANLWPDSLQESVANPCRLEPAEFRDQLGDEQRQIVERLCMHWTRARLRSLTGGFSGSLLLIAEGWKGEARTEPMVLKIDVFRQMRKELAGYYTIKDFLGKNVPTFGYPVSIGDWLGVGMELAAKEGTAETLQDIFQRAEDEDGTKLFFQRLDKALELLVEKLLRNTREVDWVVPYRDFGLHTGQQQLWLRENAALVQGYLAESEVEVDSIGPDELATIFALISGNQNGLESEVCLAHGDLNYANVICDQGDNIWFIDWTHCAKMPVELDFAKIENDAKFVMRNSLALEDLPRLRKLEEFFVQTRLVPPLDALPSELAFVKWDLRLRKLYGTVRRIRKACFSLKASEDWTIYRIALLRYAVHTLSFDARRDRGECDLVQLAGALHSVRELAYDLFSDPFHMQIRAERPEEYPIRQRLTVDEAPWSRECATYDPPYYVAPEVLAGHRPGGWADPEECAGAALATRPAQHRDREGRPLNPVGPHGHRGPRAARAVGREPLGRGDPRAPREALGRARGRARPGPRRHAPRDPQGLRAARRGAARRRPAHPAERDRRDAGGRGRDDRGRVDVRRAPDRSRVGRDARVPLVRRRRRVPRRAGGRRELRDGAVAAAGRGDDQPRRDRAGRIPARDRRTPLRDAAARARGREVPPREDRMSAELTHEEHAALDAFRRGLPTEPRNGDDAAWIGFGLRCLLEAGRVLRARATSFAERVELKHDGSPATLLEHEVERGVRDRLLRFDPRASFIGEESGGNAPRVRLRRRGRSRRRHVGVPVRDRDVGVRHLGAARRTTVRRLRRQSRHRRARVRAARRTDAAAAPLGVRRAHGRARAPHAARSRRADPRERPPVAPQRSAQRRAERRVGARGDRGRALARRLARVGPRRGGPRTLRLPQRVGPAPAEPFDLVAGALLVRGAGGEIVDRDGRPVDATRHAGPWIAAVDANGCAASPTSSAHPGHRANEASDAPDPDGGAAPLRDLRHRLFARFYDRVQAGYEERLAPRKRRCSRTSRGRSSSSAPAPARTSRSSRAACAGSASSRIRTCRSACGGGRKRSASPRRASRRRRSGSPSRTRASTSC